MTQNDVAKLVRSYLTNFRIAGISFEIPEAKIRQTEHGWRVTLIPSHLPERMSPFYEELAIIEEDLSEQEGINVLFSTADPADLAVAA